MAGAAALKAAAAIQAGARRGLQPALDAGQGGDGVAVAGSAADDLIAAQDGEAVARATDMQRLHQCTDAPEKLETSVAMTSSGLRPIASANDFARLSLHAKQ